LKNYDFLTKEATKVASRINRVIYLNLSPPKAKQSHYFYTPKYNRRAATKCIRSHSFTL